MKKKKHQGREEVVRLTRERSMGEDRRKEEKEWTEGRGA
jgi:hypothetical protein